MILSMSCRHKSVFTAFPHAGPNVLNCEPAANSPGQPASAMTERPAPTHQAVWR
jgi:hypothetical protein